jgi:hypothetical protein
MGYGVARKLTLRSLRFEQKSSYLKSVQNESRKIMLA